MSIEGKHSYRFGYLKSEKWKTVRIEALAGADAYCCICGVRDLRNDAHHVFYEDSFWDTKAEDLIILCRECHEFVHALDNRKKKASKAIAYDYFRSMSKAIQTWMAKLKERESEIKSAGECLCCRKATDDIVGMWIPGKENIPGSFGYWCKQCRTALELANIIKMKDFKLFLANRRQELGVPQKRKSVDKHEQ